MKKKKKISIVTDYTKYIVICIYHLNTIYFLDKLDSTKVQYN